MKTLFKLLAFALLGLCTARAVDITYAGFTNETSPEDTDFSVGYRPPMGTGSTRRFSFASQAAYFNTKLDADLIAIAGATGTQTTSFGRSTLSLADAAAGRAAFGVVIGTDVQAFSASLSTWATKTAPAGTVVGTSDTQTISGKSISGSTNTLTNIPAANILGVIPMGNIATGTPDGSKFVADDGTLKHITGGGDVLSSNNLNDLSDKAAALTNLGALLSSRVAKTGAYTILSTDKGKLIDTTSGTFTISLTASATLGNGFSFAVFNSGSGTITLDPNGSETIRDAASSATTKTLAQGEGGIVSCDGTGFILFKIASGSGTGDMTLAGVQTITGAKTFGGVGAVGKLIVAGTTSGTTTLDASAVASGTITFPSATDTLVGRATTDTLTNKRITPRVVSVAYAATVTPNSDTTDALLIGALTGDITIANPTGTPTDFQTLRIRIKQDGTGGRVVTLGAKYRTPSSAVLNWSAAASATDLFAVTYNAADDKWDIVALNPGY